MAGTSNWQHIGYCVDVMMRIAPQRVLDVGTGFGRWGMLLREFCEVWEGRYFPKEWTLTIDTVEAFEQNICDYHRHFYNTITIADAATWVTTERCRDYDLVILGDVMEHFERQTALTVLNRCIAGAKYVLLSIPIGEEHEQSEKYGNPFERHRSFWHICEFQRPELRHYRIFRDFSGRPCGVFVFAREDSRGVSERLFSCYERGMDEAPEIAELQQEVKWLHASRLRRLRQRVKRSLPYRALRKIARAARGNG